MNFNKSVQNSGYEAPQCSTLILSGDSFCVISGSASSSIIPWSEDQDDPLSF